MSNRSRDYYRKQRAKHIRRKKRIVKDLNDYWKYKFDGELSKGKIHCSCSLCSFHGLPMSDARDTMAMLIDAIDSDVDARYINKLDRSWRKSYLSRYYDY